MSTGLFEEIKLLMQDMTDGFGRKAKFMQAEKNIAICRDIDKFLKTGRYTMENLVAADNKIIYEIIEFLITEFGDSNNNVSILKDAMCILKNANIDFIGIFKRSTDPINPGGFLRNLSEFDLEKIGMPKPLIEPFLKLIRWVYRIIYNMDGDFEEAAIKEAIAQFELDVEYRCYFNKLLLDYKLRKLEETANNSIHRCEYD